MNSSLSEGTGAFLGTAIYILEVVKRLGSIVVSQDLISPNFIPICNRCRMSR